MRARAWALPALLLSAATLLPAAPAAAAGTQAYHVEEAGVTLSLPSGMRVLQYPVEEGNPAIPLTGYSTAQELNQYYEGMDILLEAYFPETGSYITLEHWETEESWELYSYGDLSQEELEARIADYPYYWWEEGELPYTAASVAQHEQIPFLHYTDLDVSGAVSDYYETVVNGSWLSLGAYTYAEDALTEEETAALSAAIESLSFETVSSTNDMAWLEQLNFVSTLAGYLLSVLAVLFCALLPWLRQRAERYGRILTLPGLVCRVNSPLGTVDCYQNYFVLFSPGMSPVSYWYGQTGGAVETSRCFWLYPPGRQPLALPKESFAAGAPVLLARVLSRQLGGRFRQEGGPEETAER